MIAAVVLRGPLYRMVVHYEIIVERGQKESQSPPASLSTLDIDDLIDTALDSTAQRLHFSAGKVSSDPDMLRNGGAANCIGYAALFRRIFKEELLAAGHADAYAVEQVVAQLHIGNWNVHSAFNSPFWKDHDIVRITDRTSGFTTFVDPTLYDAVGIGRVIGP